MLTLFTVLALTKKVLDPSKKPGFVMVTNPASALSLTFFMVNCPLTSVVVVEVPAATEALLMGTSLRSVTWPATEAVTVVTTGGVLTILSVVFLHAKKMVINATM